jgi:hypothetical protein
MDFRIFRIRGVIVRAVVIRAEGRLLARGGRVIQNGRVGQSGAEQENRLPELLGPE